MTPQVPRIVSLIAALALLAWVNREAPRILPAVLALVVLYVGLTNVPRVQSLIGGGQASLARLIHPATVPRRRPGPRPS